MTFKANIGSEPRTIYVSKAGNDQLDGSSVEKAKRTIASASTSILALDPPPDGTMPASMIISGSGIFTENAILPGFTNVDAINVINSTISGDLYELGSMSNCMFGLSVVNPAAGNSSVFKLENKFLTFLECTEADARGASSVGVEISGASTQNIINIKKLRAIGNEAIGVYYTAAGGQPDIFNIDLLTMEENNTEGFWFNPSSSTANAILNCGSILHTVDTPVSTAIRVMDGTVKADIGEIDCTTAANVTDGTLYLNARTVVGDIVVASGAHLFCDINNFTGTVTNNGTITGRIGVDFYGDIKNINSSNIPVNIASRSINHIFPSSDLATTVALGGTEYIVPGAQGALNITLPPITIISDGDRPLYYGWFIDIRNEEAETVTLVQNATRPGVFSGDTPITPGRSFTRVIFNGVDTFRVQTTSIKGSTIRNIAVPAPSGNRSELVYNGSDGSYSWEDATDDGYEDIGAVASDGTLNIEQGQAVEFALSGTDGVIQLPTAAGATGNIKLKVLHLIGSNNLTIIAPSGSNLQFIDEQGVSLFDTSIETARNRPIVFEPDVTRWRMFL